MDWTGKIFCMQPFDIQIESYHSVIGCTPWFKLYGKTPLLPADTNFGLTIHDLANENPKKEMEVWRKRENNDRRHSNNSKINEEDKILVKLGYKGKKRIQKGPFSIKQIKRYNGIPKTVIYIDNEGNEQVSHISNVTLYHERSREFIE